jgi:5-formyltetrahydrofolate cyclo-ligase
LPSSSKTLQQETRFLDYARNRVIYPACAVPVVISGSRSIRCTYYACQPRPYSSTEKRITITHVEQMSPGIHPNKMMEPTNQPVNHAADIAEQKRQLRRSCRQIRTALGEEARQQASLSISGGIESWPVFQRSSIILAYMPISGEVDLTTLLERQPHKRWLLPRVIPEDNHRMVIHPYEPHRLIRHPFGMDEPAPDSPTIPSNEVQLALVPGLAFDRLGRRLGYGGGYFDRFLHDLTGVSLGVIYQALLLDHLPFGEHDVSVQWLVTEQGLWQINPKA